MATLVGSATATDATFSPDRTVDLPTGVIADDVLLFVFTTANAHVIDSLGAATQIGTTQDAGTDSSTTIAYQVATGSEGSSITFTGLYTTSESGGSLCFAYRGLDVADLIEATAQTETTGTGISGPSVTPATNNCLILQIFASDPSALPSFTADTSPVATKIFDGYLDTGIWAYAGVQSYEQTTAAALALDATLSVSDDYAHFQVALNNASSGDTATVTTDPLVDGAAIAGTYTKASEWTSSDPTSATVGGVAVTGFTADGAGNWSGTNPNVWNIAVVGSAAVPTPGTSEDVVLTDGTYSTPAVSRSFNVAAGWAVVTAASLELVGQYYLYQLILDQFGETIANGNQIYYSTANTSSIDATGLIITAGPSMDIVIIQSGTALEAMTLNTESVVAPVMPADATPNRQESQTNMGIWAATSGEGITYSHSGTDAADFTYNASTALLTFIGDVGDPVSTTYDITLTATNAGGADSQNLTITVIEDSVLIGSNSINIGIGIGI